MPSAPENLKRLVAERDREVAARAYADSITRGSIAAAWHEKPVKQALGVVTVSETLNPSSAPVCCAPNTREQQKHQKEAIQEARQRALGLRQAALGDLVRGDVERWQRECAGRGLSLLPA
jgi:hypothetical protein